MTYHDPCHLHRGQGIWKESRRLLQSFPDLRFIEMEKSDQCCGGMLAIHNRELANALSKKKAKTLMEADVDIVTTECPLCRDIISKALNKESSPVAVYSVAELIEKLSCSKQTSC